MKKVKIKEVYGSKICKHVVATGHQIRLEDSTVVYKEANWKKRNLIETLFMTLEDSPLSNPSIEVSPILPIPCTDTKHT